MSQRIALDEDDFQKLVGGKVLSKFVGSGRPAVEIALSDIGFAKMEQIVAEEIRRSVIWRTVEKIDRERVEELLVSVSIACYDHESLHELREALVENVLDGTIEEGLIED